MNTTPVNCHACGIEFKKKNSLINRSRTGIHFCSRICSNKFNFKNGNPAKDRICKICNLTYKNIKKHCSVSFCPNCVNTKSIPSIKNGLYKKLTLQEYQDRLSVKGKHQSWKNAGIRDLNRNWNKELQKIPCANCKYNKHVELAHIKSLSSFSPNATLGEVNHPNNVIQLCPNCHWEFDNGKISLEKILELKGK